MNGEPPIIPIGVKSLIGSNGRLGFSATVAACVVVLASPSV